MKLYNNRHSSLLTAICFALLSLIGFSCSSDPGDVPLMYGMPTGEFEIKGAVTDEDGKDVPDAEIRVTAPDLPSGVYKFRTANTDSRGHYEVKGYEYLPEMKVVCIPGNADLQPDSVIVKMKYKDSDKNDYWNKGHAEATVNFNLKSKKPEE